VTVTSTTTQTVQPQPTCRPGSEVGPFFATVTEQGSSPLLLSGSMPNCLSGSLGWNYAPTSTLPRIRNEFIFKIDDDGYLVLAYNIPPYSYNYAVYVSTRSDTGSNWPQVGVKASIDANIANGIKVARVKGCVNSVTGELTLDAAGRTNILFCGWQAWMSFGAGDDVNRGAACVKMFPKVSAA